ncbi:biotin synthase precursor [Azorhizobium caulinodans ORS 571]|uniref:Biotin synthase n=1 Tax=Azorhizobium caulinodans (strain ATCC 43989 / DSM 5975 / JCM 20966 / LMG 6465 / NBRC 14845 / NCIMB 13405 / ORS 571) TaxID=438753 RepID=BIOB_AZOC5|nr:biotin synthase BioB [Azorhizobium caulinodans]A8IJU8.1 RecName: Full=Biotin synthase [Azorhizobium caulinodans ORS 571]BAF86359.1 biotin synthase precursor [Azorhizobium caulinodans ORS 571]
MSAAIAATARPAAEMRTRALYDLPLPELMFRAQAVHRAHFDACSVETAQLLSIKTGGCPEDCGYCSQSAHHDTGVAATRLMDVEAVLAEARKAKAAGAARFCMGAAWRAPKDRDMDAVCAMISGVRALGLETCVTLGMLTPAQVDRLSAAGLDYYNHNVDTSPAYYPRITSTRTLDDRLETLGHVRAGGIKVCCGGIVGMGETIEDRLAMLELLAGLDPHPESVPLNMWTPIDGTPVKAFEEKVDPIAFVRLVAVARLLMPRSVVRLSAGRHTLSDEAQALCFLAGANSIFVGDTLLTTPNMEESRDAVLLARLGLRPAPAQPSA